MVKIKRKNKKKIIISVCAIIIVFFISLLIQVISERNYKKEIESKEYTSINDFNTPKEYITYKGLKYIKEKESKEENIYLDIYLEFNVPLYKNKESNQTLYEDTENAIAQILKYQSFRLIDEEQELVITVICNSENQNIKNIYYNGQDNYFEKQDSINSLNSYKEEETKMEIQAKEIIDSINADWYLNKVKFGTRESTEGKYSIYKNGTIKVKTTATKIFNIVFSDNYQNNIINEIKVGMSHEEIIEKLGKPQFDAYGIIGYKGEHIYIFFGEKTASVYMANPDNSKNNEFVQLLDKFREDKDANKFITDLTDIWDDYNEYEVKDSQISISYALRGFKIQFNITNEHGIILYNNYKGDISQGVNFKNIKQNNKELPLYTYIKGNENLVFETEINRQFEFGEISS